MLKPGESGEDEEREPDDELEANGENIDDDDGGEFRSRSGVQFSSKEPQECPPTPAYARPQHQRPARRGGGVESKKLKGLESSSIPVRSAEVTSQAVPTGIYEGFILAQSTGDACLPTQSEPAIPQTLTWSPVSSAISFNSRIHGFVESERTLRLLIVGGEGEQWG